MRIFFKGETAMPQSGKEKAKGNTRRNSDAEQKIGRRAKEGVDKNNFDEER